MDPRDPIWQAIDALQASIEALEAARLPGGSPLREDLDLEILGFVEDLDRILDGVSLIVRPLRRAALREVRHG